MAKGPTEKQPEADDKAKKKAEAAKKRAATKRQLAAALKTIAELRAENARLRGPAPVRVGPSFTPPKGGRLTKAAVRQHLLCPREG